MITVSILIICIVSLRLCNTTERLVEEEKNISSSGMDTINFKTQLQPILQKNCSPCHFTGGKMYEKMPFDKGETIINHEAGILKRIKNENELVIFKQFIQEKNTETNLH